MHQNAAELINTLLNKQEELMLSVQILQIILRQNPKIRKAVEDWQKAREQGKNIPLEEILPKSK